MSLRVLAPVTGTAVALADVPDPVFAQAIVGPGLAVQPDDDGADVLAPVDGTVVKIHPHAVVLRTDDGRGLLVHLGLDTVQLRGQGFSVHAAEQDRVEAGDVLISWSPAEVRASGRSALVPVVALQAGEGALTLVAAAGDAVRAGDALFDWA